MQNTLNLRSIGVYNKTDLSTITIIYNNGIPRFAQTRTDQQSGKVSALFKKVFL